MENKDFLEEAEKEKKELEESMVESFRQRDERIRRQKTYDNLSKPSTESEKLQDDLEPIIAEPKKRKGGCGCGRSPTGLCIGWHSLTEEQYKEKKVEWEKMNDRQKEAIFHPKAIDGIGD